MKSTAQIFCILLSLGLITTVFAAEPADGIIKNALADIVRFEQQASGLTPARSSNANRILKLLNLSHERLQGSQNQDDPSWQEVNQRYVNLRGQLEGLLNPPAQTGGGTTPPTPSAPVAVSAPSPLQAGSSVPELVSGQRVRVKKMVRDIESSGSTLTITGPSALQDRAEVDARQKRLKQFEEALAGYPQVNDPDVQAARAAYEGLRQKLSEEFQRAQQQLAQLGNVQQRLATIEENSQSYPVPRPLTAPFSDADAKAWTDAASKARTVAEHNLKQLAAIAPLAYLPNNPGTPQTGSAYDANDVSRLKRNAEGKLQAIEQGYQTMAQDLKNRLVQVQNDVLSRWQDDPAGEKKWTFIREGQQEGAFKTYDEALAIARSAVALEQSLGREAKEAQTMVTKVENAKKEFTRKRGVALEASRLPEPKSTDKKLLAIAKEIVENPQYKFGEHGKIILTTDAVVERERKDSELEIDDAELTLGGDLKMSGTETTWTYKWQEFKFAVPLKDDGKDEWYIWWITAKIFSSGGSKTPLNKWISGEATKGNPILKKNLNN
ncbi:MAG: hypothetical protein K8I00_10660 [Candidatus Omnitrophica bacterium]|nr:hypothetical protein [Candidatus Omnitrophota bacterium]